MGTKMIRQKRFSKKMKQILQQTNNESLQKLSEEDIDQFIDNFWHQISIHLHSGIQIVFEGWATFYTKAVARRCRNVKENSSWMSYKMRDRWRPLSRLRSESERELTIDEYEDLKAKKNK